MEQYYKIAGLTVLLDSFGRTVEQARPYLCDPEEPDMVICARPITSPRYAHLCESDREYLVSGSSFYRQLLQFDGMMLHASAVVVDGKAYLFSADSGTGKSTHTQLWLQKFGDRAYILNDDKPALRLHDGIWYAYGTPWSGKHDISVNTGVPVAGIAMVERAEENSIVPFGGIEAVLALVRQVNRPKDQAFRARLLELLDRLMADVPVWRLRCNMDAEAVEVSYGAMAGQ